MDAEPSQAGSDDRRFTLLDGMGLIAALAACLATPRAFRGLVPEATYRVYDVRQYAQIILACWLMAFSMALAASAVFVPKPPRMERFRQPGVLAMVLIALTWAYNSIQIAVQQTILQRATDGSAWAGAFWWIFGPPYDASYRGGLAVIAGWATLSLLGLRHPSRNWLDRSGRALGLIWILWGLLASVIEAQTLVRQNTALSF